jgi:putative ABC transport system permease protein
VIGPILRALLRRQAAAVLVILEVGFGFAVSVQALVLTRWFQQTFSLPSGLDPDVVAAVAVGAQPAPLAPEAALELRGRDLAALRALDGVVVAAAVQRVPMSRSQYPDLALGDGGRAAVTWELDGAQTRATLGVPLVAGRDLRPDETDAALIDADLAAALFPDGAVGRTLVVRARRAPLRVVGVTASFRAVTAFAVDHSQFIILSDAPALGRDQRYLVRAAPGRRAGVAAAIPATLAAIDPRRAIAVDDVPSLQRQSDASARGGIAIFAFMVGVVILVVLMGTVAMTSYLVAERGKQIGTRRALGATRRDIVHHFLLESWLVTTMGVVLGLPLTVGLNLVARSFQPDLVLDWPALALGVGLFWTTGVLAALLPARRAATIPPSVATRTV